MMASHVTREELRALREHRLDAGAIAGILQHLSGCGTCGAMAGEGIEAGPALASLRAGLAEAAHPDLELEIFAYADGTLDRQRRAAVDEHLFTCSRCREDLADARTERAQRQAPRRVIWSALAAAAIIAIVTAIYFRPAPAPGPISPQPRAEIGATPSLRRAGWQAIVEGALQARRIAPPPGLRSGFTEPDTLRGETMTAERAALAPSGVVVAAARPRFTWPSHGESAVVSVYEGRTLVARSPAVAVGQWTPESPLPRGPVYAWQVERTIGGARSVLPAPTDPPALFRIADEKSWRAIEDARQASAGDHLLLAILEARAGLKGEALQDFDAYAAAHPGDASVQALADSVRAW